MKKIGIVFFVIMAISFAVFLTVQDHSKTKRLHSEFKEVYTKDEFKGIITDLYTDRGACFVTSGSKKIFLHNSANSLYRQRFLQDNLSIGDSIVKKSWTDSLFIFRGNSKYYFVLGKLINESPR
ncbi:hypothetical protein [Mangrovibacterium diazotrophicum]|uniref:hypothetical protein n=1 Tax=Mangrovibacterium diazotrophicum TaxID=1261403 RepID=UPI000E75479D|nr:hypothetical protein [Mangrovibacterium diazotrophicum]